VFAVAGPCGLGALDAAKGRGKWGVGVDVDQSYLGNFILTSAVKRVDTGSSSPSRERRAARASRVARISSST
jgi:basic membrane protein A